MLLRLRLSILLPGPASQPLTGALMLCHGGHQDVVLPCRIIKFSTGTFPASLGVDQSLMDVMGLALVCQAGYKDPPGDLLLTEMLFVFILKP